MAALQDNITPVKGVVQFFAGTSDLATFGTQIAAYGNALGNFSKILRENPVDTTTVSIAKDCGLLMVELQNSLPESHLFIWVCLPL